MRKPYRETKSYRGNQKVKPCPECQGRNITFIAYCYPYPTKTVKECIVECEDCGYCTDDHPTETQALSEWNNS